MDDRFDPIWLKTITQSYSNAPLCIVSTEVDVTVEINLGMEQLREKLKLINCSAINGPHSPSL